jgi:cytochrome P450
MPLAGRHSTGPSSRPPALALANARWRSFWMRRPLPPGDLVDIERAERADRRLLLQRAARYGPVFKGLAEGRLLVCVVGLPLGRRLLKAHAADLQPVTLQLQSLFPLGFLRQMEGESHRQVRRAIVRGINALDLRGALGDLQALATEGLRPLWHDDAKARPSPARYAAVLSNIASGMLLRVFFGAAPGGSAFDRLMQGYTRLGPHGLLWNIGEKQAEAFAALRDELRAQAAAHQQSADAAFARGLFAKLVDAAPVDDTLLGNLIYMVEMGRYDLRGLLRWISKYAAENPAWLERIAAQGAGAAEADGDLSEAFVLETLRMDQSERLMRRVLRDIVFDGMLIPKGSMLRVCMWEAHKSADAFARPFDFDPSRFCGGEPGSEQFSPFGLDHHHCPFANASILMARQFLQVLARDCRLRPVGGGGAVRGAYHWEPASDFALELQRRLPEEAP